MRLCVKRGKKRKRNKGKKKEKRKRMKGEEGLKLKEIMEVS